MLVQCWGSVVDDGPTLNQHWVLFAGWPSHVTSLIWWPSHVTSLIQINHMSCDNIFCANSLYRHLRLNDSICHYNEWQAEIIQIQQSHYLPSGNVQVILLKFKMATTSRLFKYLRKPATPLT